MAIISDEKVLGFEFPIHNSLCMQYLKSHDDFSGEAENIFLLEHNLLLFEVKVYVTPGQVLHHNVDHVLVLEGLLDMHE